MEKQKKIRQQISELVDGELDPDYVSLLVSQLREPEIRVDWDMYHRIGDVLRSEQMAAEPRAGFAERISARLEREPSFIAPRRKPSGGRLQSWPVALAAVAAAAMGFMLSPSLFHSPVDGKAPASLAAQSPASSQALLVDAGNRMAHTAVAIDTADYIRLHHSANPTLYRVPISVPGSTGSLAHPAALSSSTEK